VNSPCILLYDDYDKGQNLVEVTLVVLSLAKYHDDIDISYFLLG